MNALSIREERSNDYYHIRLYALDLDDNGEREIRRFEIRDTPIVKVSSQGENHGERPRDLYAWRAGFADADVESVEQARCMLRVMTTLHKGMARAAEEDGEPADFADYCGRVAKALGIARFCVHVNAGCWGENPRFRAMTRAEGIDYIRRMDRDWRAEPAQGARAVA